MNLADRLAMKETVEFLVENFKLKGISLGRSISFIEVLSQEISIENSYEEFIQYICTVLLASFTIQVTRVTINHS
jgi:hypothetical protein